MEPPKQMTAKLSDRIIYNDRYCQYHFELVEPFKIHNQAGQYVMLQIDEKTMRAYSMCDRPDIDSSFEILVDQQPAGAGTTFLKNLPLGAEVKLMAPLGQLYVPTDSPAKQLILVATGSGISPFKAIVTDQLQLQNNPRPITLIWGMRHDSEFFWLDFFTDLAQNYPQLTFIPVVSQPSPDWALATGHVTDFVDKLDFTDSQVLLCGNPKMIEANKALLEKHQLQPSQIIIEQFGT